MQVGDAILTTSVTVRDQPTKPTLQVSYKAPRGEAFVMLILGTTDGKSEFSVDEALNELGWYFKGDAA